MVIIRADGNAEIGMGHIGRCLSVAKALRKIGVDVLWVASDDSSLNGVEDDIEIVRTRLNYNSVWNDALCKAASDSSVTSVLIDSYWVKPNELAPVCGNAHVYYLDDLNMFDYNVSGIINYNFEADESMYENMRFKQRKLFLGPRYFPLNSELWDVPRRAVEREVKKVLISTGSTDCKNITDKVLRGIDLSRYKNIAFYVLFGKFFGDGYKAELIDKYGQSNNVKFIEWGQNIVRLYDGVDILIAPGATMVFEALALGIPCMSFMFADNQKAQCDFMEKSGFAPYIGDLSDKAVNFFDKFKIMLNYDERKFAQERVSRVIDGRGAQRIADILAAR